MNRFAVTTLTLVLLLGCADDDPDGPLPDVDAAIGDDAATTADAGTPSPDAWTMPGCPSYATDVQPIYRSHCSNCHTTGRDAHFGSSISVARQASSACGTGMAACTIQLGRPGGSMARRDRLGGFSATEITTLQSWIDCGMPN